MTLTSTLDTALDRALIGYGNVGWIARRAWWPPDPAPHALRGRVAMVTGAKTGIGRAATTGLARLGARVHMVVRGREEGEAVRAEILRAVPGAELVVDECDVSLMASVRAYAAAFHGPLHVVVHNAGVMPGERQTTDEGNELTLATHVLGPHLLTGLLRGALAADPPARVIWLSSGGMYPQRLRVDDLQYEHGTYRAKSAYARTKRMQVVLAEEWARRLDGEGVTVHAMHPGWVETPGVKRWLPVFRALTRPLLRTPEQGADTAVWLAAAGEPLHASGAFWHDRRRRSTHYVARTRETSSERRALWEACRRLTGVPPA
jgi:NAD(P)-dependent dehydrogenase (short-subunit alcohol dehydrogenase family)